MPVTARDSSRPRGSSASASGSTARARRRSRSTPTRSRSTRMSGKRELLEPLLRGFSGRDFEPMIAAIEAVHAQVLRGRVFVALHMHAGDGNVHTNIPVNSDNYQMLREANQAVARIMAFARS